MYFMYFHIYLTNLFEVEINVVQIHLYKRNMPLQKLFNPIVQTHPDCFFIF